MNILWRVDRLDEHGSILPRLVASADETQHLPIGRDRRLIDLIGQLSFVALGCFGDLARSVPVESGDKDGPVKLSHRGLAGLALGDEWADRAMEGDRTTVG